MTNKNSFNLSVSTVINTIQTRFGKMARVAILISAMGLMSAAPATAQVRFGLKGGLTMSELKDKSSVLDTKNHTAYTGGLMLDLNIPKTGLGLEVSALYRHIEDQKAKKLEQVTKNIILDLPVYARYRLSIPGVERVVAPVVFTGPNISVKVKSVGKLENPEEERTRFSWDVGAGVDLFKHMRLTASYGIGMKKAMEVVGRDYKGGHVEGKDHCWNVSASYLF